VIRADGTGLHRLGHRTRREGAPAWSSDGRSIAFVTEHSLFVMRADGSRVRRLYRIGAGTYFSGAPSWSPDGRSLAFGLYDEDLCSGLLMVIGRDGRGPRNLTVGSDCGPSSLTSPGADGDEVAADDSDPDWSPDGTRITAAARCHAPFAASFLVFRVRPSSLTP
jgi:Tol biopolymer transport system component